MEQSTDSPRWRRWLLASVAALLALFLIAALALSAIGWNWARAPLERLALERTGRALVIGGDLTVTPAWPAPRVRARSVTFANPAWAAEAQMLVVDAVELRVDLPALLRQTLVFPEVHLTHPVVALELGADGRKSWLLDRDQLDENARIRIGRLTLDQGRLGVDDVRQHTALRIDVATQDAPADGVAFSASGLFKGQALTARGTGGPVIGLRDADLAYPLKIDASVGRTRVQAEGTITGLAELTAADLHLAVRGDSLAQLYPLLGIALPPTGAYAFAGQLVHSGTSWRYDKFSGRVGKSDLAGSLQVMRGGVRSRLSGELVSQRLDFADLGPLIGAKPKAATAGAAAASSPRVLPELPLDAEQWNSVDADVTLRAKTILRDKALPLDNLVAHLVLADSQLTLDPLDFGLAGGHLQAVISLDGRQSPILAKARIKARKLLLAQLFPTLDLARASVGQVNGDIDLTGQGDSVGRMLATADGRASLVVADGQISKLLMEQMGLHLLEILQLKLSGDKSVALRCAVADFGIKRGVMQANALLLDTEVSTLVGNGSIDLARETLDLTLVPKTRSTSPIALRSPIHVRGTFANPVVALDTGRVAARGLGALALGLINPLLALMPLIEQGPGPESACARLIAATQAPLPRTPASAPPLKVPTSSGETPRSP